jgi:hypothetical protein
LFGSGAAAVFLCYVDESGCTGALPSASSQIQPVLVIAGFAVSMEKLHGLTRDFLHLKMQFYPPQGQLTRLDAIQSEVKGNSLRKAIADGARRDQRAATGFVDKALKLLQKAEARVFGRIWIKGIGNPFNGPSVYSSSIQSMAGTFQNLLEQNNDRGAMIIDSRTHTQNSTVSHSLFTQKYRSSGDPYNRLIETPTFGHSNNHAGLQLADLVCSALVWPMAVHAYCVGHVTSSHVRPGYAQIRQRYGPPMKALQHRYDAQDGRRSGGLVVSDDLARRPTTILF